MSNVNDDYELSWDSVISKESEFELLPAGNYNFVVTGMERGRFPGSEKMKACPTAVLSLKLTGEDGATGTVTDTLYLSSKAEWRLSQFFTAIGQKKKGEDLRPNWNTVTGSNGKLELSVNEYTKKDGTTGKSNRVGKYLPREELKAVPSGF